MSVFIIGKLIAYYFDGHIYSIHLTTDAHHIVT